MNVFLVKAEMFGELRVVLKLSSSLNNEEQYADSWKFYSYNILGTGVKIKLFERWAIYITGGEVVIISVSIVLNTSGVYEIFINAVKAKYNNNKLK